MLHYDVGEVSYISGEYLFYLLNSIFGFQAMLGLDEPFVVHLLSCHFLCTVP